MAISITDQFNLSSDALEQVGAFDAVLDVDSRLFIDPLLLRSSAVPEFGGVEQVIDTRLGNVLRLLVASTAKEDSAWRSARRLMEFPEVKGLCIGYSSKGTGGSGMGSVLRERLLGTAKEIVDAGIDDPALFELMGLLEEKIGADRISDMFAGIAIKAIARYSARVFGDLGIDGSSVDIALETYRLPVNPFNDAPVLLVPTDVLRALPVAESWSDIDTVVAANAALRDQVNALIGGSWKEARYWPKSRLRDLLIERPETLRGLLDAYRPANKRPYDIGKDPDGRVVWYSIARDAAANNPMFLARRANDLDISPETDSGRGAVDFKISRGYVRRVVVETKLTSNPNLLHGYEVQLEEYMKAEKTRRALYLVVDVQGGSEERLKELRRIVAAAQAANKNAPALVIVDGRPKASASTYRPDA